jgi:hypothetical protein
MDAESVRLLSNLADVASLLAPPDGVRSDRETPQSTRLSIAGENSQQPCWHGKLTDTRLLVLSIIGARAADA